MADYLLIIRIPIPAMDDPEARNKAQALLKQMQVPEGTQASMKLQKLEAGKPPTGVALK
jgi:hypothetical protein